MSRTYLEKKKKKFVREHANFCCEYCQSSEDFSTQTFVMEHIIPIYANGDNSTDNLALSCQGCNGFKYVKTNGFDEVVSQVVELFNPRKEDWTTHFEWNEDFTIIVPRTAVGRVTVSILQLNRPSVVNLRKAVFFNGTPSTVPYFIIL